MSYASAAAAAALRRFWLWRNRGRFSQLPPRHTPRLLVDVSAILQHDARTGIQRVVRAIFSELMRRSGADFLVVPIYATRRAGYRYAPRDFLTASRTSLGSEPVQAGPNDTFLGLDLAAHVLPAYQAQLRAWRANGATIHLVVYDLLPLMNPGWFTKRALWHFRRWFDFLAADADQAICISGAVASEVTRELARRNSAMPIGRLTLGGDIMSSVPSMGIDAEVEFVLERIRFRPAILMVGTVEPRKGHEVALRAFEYLWRDRADDAPDLVIVGKPGWKTEALQARILSHPELG
jgi:glycosyltransferase involved in cell wall biosynthesis